MTKLNLETKKTTKGTLNLIKVFLYENRETLNKGQKEFYLTIYNMLDMELKKPSKFRCTMLILSGRAFNVEDLIVHNGATEVITEYIKTTK